MKIKLSESEISNILRQHKLISEEIEISDVITSSTPKDTKNFKSFVEFLNGNVDLDSIADDIEKYYKKDETEDETKKVGDVNSAWMDITKKVIDKFEGGYWNPKCGHPRSGMGKSTETMFGLDRYNGNIESTSEGKEFFGIIDKQKKELGMTKFCNKWKWLYKGGEHEDELKDLAARIMKRSYDRNMRDFVEDSEAKKRIEGNRSLLLHMSYACWNGPAFFQKFANSLEDGVKKGLSDKQLVDLAIKDRSKTGLLNKDKVERAIRNA